MQYLILNNNKFYFRIRIPTQHQQLFKRKEIKRSLQTRCYNTARSLNKKWLYHYDTLIQRLNMNILTDKQIKLYVDQFLNFTLQELENERLKRDNPSNNLMDELDLYQEYKDEFKDCIINGNYTCVEQEVKDILHKNNIKKLDDNSHNKLSREIIKARIKILNIEEQRSQGNYDTYQPPELYNQKIINDVKHSPALVDVANEYIKEKSISKSWSSDTHNTINNAFKVLFELIGKDRDIVTIDHKELIEFRNSLLFLPKNISKKKDYKDKTIKELISMKLAKELTLSANTINKYTSRVTSLFEYALKHGYIRTNPAQDLRLENKGKENEERHKFTDIDLENIFKMPIYSSALKNTLIKKPEQFWIPLFGLYQGMRLNEICQLYKDDIYTVDDIWCIDINDKLDKKVKNISSKRVIPIHPLLIKLGFLDYVNSLSDANPRIWQNITYTQAKGYSNGIGKSFLRLKNKYVTEDGKKVFHSFRHNVADNLKQSLQPEPLIEALLGHSNTSMSTSRYGKDYKPQVLLDMLNKLKYSVDDSLMSMTLI